MVRGRKALRCAPTTRGRPSQGYLAAALFCFFPAKDDINHRLCCVPSGHGEQEDLYGDDVEDCWKSTLQTVHIPHPTTQVITQIIVYIPLYQKTTHIGFVWLSFCIFTWVMSFALCYDSTGKEHKPVDLRGHVLLVSRLPLLVFSQRSSRERPRPHPAAQRPRPERERSRQRLEPVKCQPPFERGRRVALLQFFFPTSFRGSTLIVFLQLMLLCLFAVLLPSSLLLFSVFSKYIYTVMLVKISGVIQMCVRCVSCI